jgi:DNA modification methylase
MGTKILVGNNMDKLKEIYDSTVDCVVSSPPYFGLRDYGTGTWEGLDPFGGSGTTGLVANNLGRDAILIELNEEYVEIAKKRIGGDNPLFSEVEDG